MKKLFLSVLCILSVFIILLSPQTVMEGVRNGIRLNLYSVIPSLLPFMVLSNIMLKYNLCQYISYIFKPFLSKIFKISSNGCFATIIGFTCGYPMGAKIIGELYSQKMLSKSEACYLITFCNNCSITFLLNYIIYECLGAKIPVSTGILFVYIPPIITGLINKFFFHIDVNSEMTKTSSACHQHPIFAAVKSMSILSVYIICFTVVAKWIETMDFLPFFIKILIAGITEITSGANFIVTQISNNMLRMAFIFACTIFGGVSIMLQSFEQLPCIELKKYYVIGKVEQLFLYGVLFSLYTFFLKFTF